MIDEYEPHNHDCIVEEENILDESTMGKGGYKTDDFYKVERNKVRLFGGNE